MSEKIQLHDQYLKENPKYVFVDEWFEGDLNLLRFAHLIPHISETQPTVEAALALRTRRERTGNENEVRPHIEMHTAHLNQIINFEKLPQSERLKPLLNDVTGRGVPPQDQLKTMCKQFLKHGKVGVLVEGPSIQGSESQAQVQTTNERSYEIVFEATQILDWFHFPSGPKRGELAEVTLFHSMRKDGEKKVITLHRFSIGESGPFIKEILEGEELVKQDGSPGEFKVIETKTGKLDKIPFVIVGDGIEETIFHDIAERNKVVFNLESIHDSILYYGGFETTIIAGVNPDDIKTRAEFTVITSNRPDISVHTIAASDPAAIERRIVAAKESLRRKARFDPQALTNESTKNIQSADSKSEDNKTKIEIYNSILDKMQSALKQIWTFHCVYEGVQKTLTPEVEISINRDFQLENEAEEIAKLNLVMTKAKEIQAEKTYKKAFKQLIEMTLDLDDEELKELQDEVDNQATLEPPTPPGMDRLGSFQ